MRNNWRSFDETPEEIEQQSTKEDAAIETTIAEEYDPEDDSPVVHKSIFRVTSYCKPGYRLIGGICRKLVEF